MTSIFLTLTLLLSFNPTAIAQSTQDAAGPMTRQEILSRLKEAEARHLSQADIAAEVEAMRSRIQVVETYVPFSLLGAGAFSLVIGAFVYWRRRGPAIDVSAAAPALTPAPHREPVSSASPR